MYLGAYLPTYLPYVAHKDSAERQRTYPWMSRSMPGGSVNKLISPPSSIPIPDIGTSHGF